jgi:hypothetical protein
MKTITTLSSAIALSFAMNAAIAGPNHSRLVAEFDVDKDGSITRAEVDQVLSEKFATADADGDGMLTKEEMSAAHEQRKQQHISERFAEIDANGDGSLNLEEFANTLISSLQNRIATHCEDNLEKLCVVCEE